VKTPGFIQPLSLSRKKLVSSLCFQCFNLYRYITAAAAGSAKTRIELLLDEVLTSQSLPYTHFLNIPLNLGTIPDAARAFRAAVLSSPWADECRVDEDIFFEPGGGPVQLLNSGLNLELGCALNLAAPGLVTQPLKLICDFLVSKVVFKRVNFVPLRRGHLHLTLAMLKLYSDERRHKAKLLVHEVGAAVRAILSEDIHGGAVQAEVS
jgi:hypothetical protein